MLSDSLVGRKTGRMQPPTTTQKEGGWRSAHKPTATQKEGPVATQGQCSGNPRFSRFVIEGFCSLFQIHWREGSLDDLRTATQKEGPVATQGHSRQPSILSILF